MALRTAASPVHEVACRGRRSDRDRPLRGGKSGGGLSEKTGPKRLCSMLDERDAAGRCGLGGV